MEKSYQPETFESRLYQRWEDGGYFRASGEGEPYTIMLPPPNVTGTLHMGHAFQHTLQDALIRYHRMRGFDTLWQLGTDHAGIATEMVVNRNLPEGESRDSLGREKFIEKVWEWREQSGHTIERQMRRLGTSGDWDRAMFTMDPMAVEAVKETFVQLFEQGHIYRGQRLVNWDPVLKTAISDLEVVSEEENGNLWSIFYPFADQAAVAADAGEELKGPNGEYGLTVATTRPETMLGDVAVAVHPEDERYAKLVDMKLRLPLTGREIPVIADDYVERDFGTGCVKITPAHDFNDYAIGERHGLPLINVLSDTAAIRQDAPRIDIKVVEKEVEAGSFTKATSTASWPIRTTETMPQKYWGLDRYDARKAIVADLESAGLLVETKPHKLMVPRGDRTGQVIEPYLTDQWFVKMDELGARGLELAEKGDVRFVPGNWINTYRHWMANIQDWCISRQLWWGHRIPAWYDAEENIYVGRSEGEAKAKFESYLLRLQSTIDESKKGNMEAGSSNAEGVRQLEILIELLREHGLRQDDDVLETWFSSGIWSHSTLGWPNAELMAERGFDRYLPTSVLVTGFDIIFFWVARMIMMTEHFTGKVPFRDVYITGLVRDAQGQKMSKSKGNILDPIDLIDGIDLEALVEKRTRGLMQPQMAAKIEKATRKEFPDGIPAFGADALRFTLAALASHGRDIKFDLSRCEGYKNFCNKLWNAARFALMNCADFSLPSLAGGDARSAEGGGPENPKTDAERWILSRLAHTTREVHEQFAAYRFDLVAQAVYEFTWNELCDWFLELAKPALNGDDTEAAASTRHTLLYVIEATLRLLHPLVPFVTEEIWQHIAPKLGIDGETISLRTYPENDDFAVHAEAEADIEWLKSAVSGLRRIRSEMGVPPSRHVPLLLQGGNDPDRARASRFDGSLRFLSRLESIDWLDAGTEPPAAAAAVLGELKLLIPLEGLIDLDAERARLDKEIKRIEGEIGKCNGKLGNARFVDNAPADVVEQERARLAEWTTQLDGLKQQRQRLG